MKSVLISIQPKWCELIVSGKKTIEVRKTRPKIETPFKCYIYCTQGKFKDLGIIGNEIYQKRMKVIGEFVCDRIINIKPFGIENMEEFEKQTCLKANEIVEYLKGFYGYGWHISNLVIYDKPKELCEFHKHIEIFDSASITELEELGILDARIKRPPQSWCYVEKGGAE